MAGDLIPPPSPAGRPPPDAMAGVRADAAEEPPPVAPGPEMVEAPFRTRFGFIWGVLTGVAVCVLAVSGVLVVTADDDSGPPLAANWSSWTPSTSRMLDGAEDIAEHVSRQYQLDSGAQMTTIRSGPPEYAGLPAGVAVRPSGGQVEILKGDAVQYNVSLLDETDNTIDRKLRDRLLRREGLELALYSFRYLDDVTMVTILLPAANKEDDTKQLRALFWRPGDLLSELQVPLAKTLSAQTPRPKTFAGAEAARVDSLALRHRFDTTIQALDNNLGYYVLSEPEIVDGS
jgi:hypothetical protein